MKKKKIVVAMSGGVDSSVTAALLQKEGHEVIGVTLRLFEERKNAVKCCGGADSAAKARASAQALGIRHYFKSAQGLFSKAVIDNFTGSYLAGATPNPCVECNRHLKFSYLFDLALSMGADALATGHYAVIKKRGAAYGLYRGADPLKDQSYFLYCLRREQLDRLLFPLGGMPKTEVRRLAAEFGLPSARAQESHDICFVTEGDYSDYLRSAGVKPRPGYIVDLAGKRLGKHNGFFNFTVGQRRGTGVYGGARLYVTEVRPGPNEVVLGPLEAAHSSGFSVSGLNWLADIKKPEFASAAQIRYRHKPAKCVVRLLAGGDAEVRLEKPQFAVAPGQAAVFYDGDRVLGGGTITGKI
ncbi:MAG TPA: tRNA 2-thiouridine(34) synthase MnmA [Elusimicrobia bacterium]|nr:MAG: tRNA 2-thiouridine(34) synthase MnmA [Elusimicrobia bacterium GWD2_63_28]HCC46603.1 tRNA 2-thiouridine(34) synthase MnmA [Elusimicrobiota bacterium]